jgi:hypothetical protein
MKIPLEGGAPETIARVNRSGSQTLLGADWGTDGSIVFAQRSRTSNFMGLYRVSAAGGTPTELLSADLEREEEYAWPSGCRTESTCCSASRGRVGDRTPSLCCRSQPVRSKWSSRMPRTADWRQAGISCSFVGEPAGRELQPAATQERRGIDRCPARLRLQASSRSVAFTLAAGAAAMVFRDPSLFNSSMLVWVDRQGRATPTGIAERNFRQPRLSPDGHRLAVDISGASSRDIWIDDFRRGVLSRRPRPRASKRRSGRRTD